MAEAQPRKRVRRPLIIVAAVVGFGAALSFAVPAISAQNSEPPTYDVPLDSYDLAIVESGRADQLPKELQGGDLAASLRLETVRHLASDDGGADYWAVIDEYGFMCVLAYIDADEWVTGVGCTPPEKFVASGASLRVAGSDIAREVYLVPDSPDVEGIVKSLKGTTLGPNLVVLDPTLPSEERRTSSDPGAGFALEVFPEPIEVDEVRQ